MRGTLSRMGQLVAAALSDLYAVGRGGSGRGGRQEETGDGPRQFVESVRRRDPAANRIRLRFQPFRRLLLRSQLQKAQGASGRRSKSTVIPITPAFLGSGPKYDIGPLGLAFLDKDHLVVGDGSRKEGEDFVRVYKIPGEAPRPERLDQGRAPRS